MFAAKKPAIDIVGVLAAGPCQGDAEEGRPQGGGRRSLKALLCSSPTSWPGGEQQAGARLGQTILKKGIDLMVISNLRHGDPKLYKRHIKAPEKSGARLRLPSGAIAGPSGFAMRLGSSSVKYVSTAAARLNGTPAETEFDLPSIKEPTVIFRGSPPMPAGSTEERQSRGDGGAVRRRTRPYRHRAGRRSHPAARHPRQPPRGERFGRTGDGAARSSMPPDNPKTGVLTALTMADDLMKMVRASDW